MSDSEAKVGAEAKFKRREEQIRQGAEAWAQYEAATRDIAEKTKRLRALRLAREADQAKATKHTSSALKNDRES
jgi:hypothetical protein